VEGTVGKVRTRGFVENLMSMYEPLGISLLSRTEGWLHNNNHF
jgi:hypothetical protein